MEIKELVARNDDRRSTDIIYVRPIWRTLLFCSSRTI